ncbi:Uu.00g120010.m01.CDS01 [Anthostomella pinea]|uniref:Uu.00g120010.m01.CDS01 n=1 Tax=Anthostomella pinea TaxID=933095 RepID=A0AAI8YHB2_9PEZI|nr:Uu.00g120010.m01.CDS01 [Anthostomella pinea]
MTMRHCDTQQLLQNVFMFDGDVLLMTDRDKNKAIRGIGRMAGGAVGGQALLVTLDEWLWKDGQKGRWETAELSKQLAALTGQHIGVELTVADYRHVTIELGRKIRGLVVRQLEVDIGTAEQDDIGGGGGPRHEDPATGETREQQKTESIWDLGGGDQDRDNDHKSAGKDKKRQAKAASRGRDDDKDSKGSKKKKVGSVRPSPRATERKDGRDKINNSSSNGSCETGIDDGLRTLLGINARWKTEEQRAAMAKVMAIKDGQALIVVLPTGGGKSILFMLPAVTEKTGTTVVVVPFVALMDDLVARARDFGVDSLRWQTAAQTGRDEPQREARLVVVSADVASSNEFITYADGLRTRGLLRQIFIDECHKIIMDAEYRAKLAGLQGLYRFDCPVVLLTATLPVRLERWFRQAMVAEVKAGKGMVEEEVVRTVMRIEKGMRSGQKGVVYC